MPRHGQGSATSRDTSKMRQQHAQPGPAEAGPGGGHRSHSHTVRLSNVGQPPGEQGTAHHLLSRKETLAY
jgi:hypothetical protein